jgi:predicted TIM-barrel fold metal-dependent hydrolase
MAFRGGISPGSGSTAGVPSACTSGRQCYAVIDCGEDVARYTIDYLGDENLLLSTDYPPHDSPFPEGINTLVGLQGLSAESKRKILWDNGARLFGLEAHRPAAVS